jgi:microcystin-dependent protein
MTVSSELNRTSAAGNGVTTAFAFPYYFLDEDDLTVILKNNTTGVETEQTITTHYTVSGAGVESGGTITFVSAPASGVTIVIYRDPTAIQDLDLEENDPFPAANLERALDKVVMVAQRLKDRVDRSITLPEGFTDSFDTKLPAEMTADAVLKINAAGTGLEMGPTSTEIENAETNATAAAASASAAAASASSASTSATSASASAASAAAAVESAFFRDVVYISFADSPYTITQAHNGKLISVDSSGGAVAITVPEVANVTLPFNVGFKVRTYINNVTISRSGTDTIEGSTSKVLSASGAGCQLVADADLNPDQWSVLDLGVVPNGFVNSLTQVSAASDDYVAIADMSDSGNNKKVVASEFLMPAGIILPFGGTSAPNGFLLCDGLAVSRSTYANLFAAISTRFGQGDGSTTFNLPDMRGQFLRGVVNIPAVTGSGSASSNNATFTGHGINRTGMPVRFTSGALTGISGGVTYYAIVIDANTLAFATSYANALAGTKIAISGANSAVVQQWLDPDATSRTSLQNGGSSGAAVGSQQEYQLEAHTHNYGAFAPPHSASGANGNISSGSSYSTSSTGGNETRPRNVGVNYIIKT